MKHKISGYKLQRNASARKALLRGLVISRQKPGRPRGMQELAAAQGPFCRRILRSVIVEERITTTVTKAKASAPLLDKMITLAKKGDLASRFGGGYARVLKLAWRQGVDAETAILELVGSELVKRSAERASAVKIVSKLCAKVRKAARADARLRVARQTVFHGNLKASAIILPVVNNP